MTTMMEIEEAIKSIETKKQSLKQSFDLLQQHSHSISSFTLSWPQIDSHFSQIQSSLQSRFSLIQQNHQSLPQFHHLNPENAQKIQSLPELEPTPDGKNPKDGQMIQSLPKLEQTPDGKNPKNGQKIQSLSKLERNEEGPCGRNPRKERLKSVCEKMDSKSLRNLVRNCLELKEWGANELSQALKYAPDPCKLVLDATEEVIPRGLSSVILLESLMMIEGVEVSEEKRDRAKCMAMKWKNELDKEDRFPFDALSVLTLLGAFKLVNDFDKDDVLELVYITSKNNRTLSLCRVLELEDRIPELVQKLIANKRELNAIRFIQEFKLVDQFSCVGLLRSYLKECRKTATQIRKTIKNDPKAMIDGDAKEKAALSVVIKYIKDYKLDSEFPPENLEQRLEKLDEMRDKRRNKKQKKKMGLEQHEQPANYTAPPQQHYLQPPIFPAGPPPPGVGPSSVGPYGIPGPMPNDPHGLSGSFVGYGSSPSTVGPQLHAMGSQLPSSSHQGPSHFVDAYGFPPHHPYHPQ